MDGKNLASTWATRTQWKIEPPAGVSFEADAKTRQIRIMGPPTRNFVGQIAANIRKVRPPEPYHREGCALSW